MRRCAIPWNAVQRHACAVPCCAVLCCAVPRCAGSHRGSLSPGASCNGVTAYRRFSLSLMLKGLRPTCAGVGRALLNTRGALPSLMLKGLRPMRTELGQALIPLMAAGAPVQAGRAHQHDEEQHAQREDVHGGGVRRTSDDLRGHKAGAAQGACGRGEAVRGQGEGGVLVRAPSQWCRPSSCPGPPIRLVSQEWMVSPPPAHPPHPPPTPHLTPPSHPPTHIPIPPPHL